MVVPLAVAVNATEQVPAANVQLVGLNVPAAPVLVKDTVPVGVLPDPVTIAVHVDAWPTTTGVVHDTLVELVPAFATTVPVPVLAA